MLTNVRILAVIRAQTFQKSAMESLTKQLQTSLKRASLKTAASRRPGRRKHSSAPFIIAIVVFFLACNVAKNLSDPKNHVCLRQGV